MSFQTSPKTISLQKVAADHVMERSNREFTTELTGDVIVLDGALFHVGTETDNLNRPGPYARDTAVYQFDVDADGNVFVIYSASLEYAEELAEEGFFSDPDGYAAEYRRSAGMPPLG